jgi:hypothetical protein
MRCRFTAGTHGNKVRLIGGCSNAASGGEGSTVEIADDAISQPLILEHEKPAAPPAVRAPASAPYQPPWSLLGLVVPIQLAWLSVLEYFLYRLAS